MYSSSNTIPPSGGIRHGATFHIARPDFVHSNQSHNSLANDLASSNLVSSTLMASSPLVSASVTDVPMLVQLASQMTPLELNAPILQSSTKKSFEFFLPLYQAYVNKRGIQPLAQLMSVNVQSVYAVRLSLTLKDFLLLSNGDLLVALYSLHGINVIGIGFTDKLESVTMLASEVYDRTLCELYLENFLALLNRVPTLRDPSSGGATEKQLARVFIKGIFPLYFRLLVDQRKPDSLKAAISSFTDFFPHMDLYNTIALARSSSASSVCLAPSVPVIHFASTAVLRRGKCFNCQGLHHYINCPQRVYCIPCNTFGHL